jgi:hypothetical protein
VVSVHVPFRHRSFVVHALLSLHGVVSGRPLHDVAGVLPGQAMHWYTWSAMVFGAVPLGGATLFTPHTSSTPPQVVGPQPWLR